ncbi:MAG: MraY family glycosyltransferase [Actinomycetota bacterium]|nr:MraY family glycosyltransferase [Actinomycetota bacterium]
MNPWLVAAVLVGSGILSWAVVSVSIRVSHRLAVYDHPDADRKTQDHPIPKLGGVAVAGAFTLVVAIMLLGTGRTAQLSLALAVLIPGLVAAMIGFLDDRQHLNPYLRLILQAGVGVLAWVLGTRLSVTGVVVVDAAILVLWVMVIVNGTNLLDNSDGLAGTTVLVSAAGASLIAAMYGQVLVSLMGAALVGVAAGFLWHNWFPAKVYMGDAGAYFLGTLLALLTVRLRPESAPAVVGVAIAVLLVLLPLVDTTYVVLKRFRAGIHPFTAGRDHMSHVLQDRGRSVPGSVLTLQLVGLAGVVAAVILGARYR